MNRLANLKLDEQLAAEIRAGVKDTFGALFGVRPVFSIAPKHLQSALSSDIYGVIALTQEAFEGVMIVSFPKATIAAMLGRLYGQNFNGLEKAIQAGVGEVTNIIFGGIKTGLNRGGFALHAALPDVVIGDCSDSRVLFGSETLRMSFQTELGAFDILVAIYPERARRTFAA